MLHRVIDMDKRGVELAVNVIIIVVIGLLILAVVLFIMSGQLSKFRQGTDQCNSGICVSSVRECEDMNMAANPSRCDESGESRFCCISLGGG